MKIEQDWVQDPALQTLLALLSVGAEEARVAGGAVRNALMDEPIADIDVATTREPQDVVALLMGEGHRAIGTGIDHGTVTAIIDGKAFEVTTLRQDVETDGRHAVVRYGRDWIADAERRDFTMNALYMDADGTIFDPLGGREDVASRTVRFIGEPSDRIREDYLRILRFFRFFAWYGTFRPDADGLRACTHLKEGLDDLSVERIWMELSKLLAAPDPTRAILWMRQTGVLTRILPESEKWGIDFIPGLIKTERKENWSADPLLRLMAMVPPDAERMLSLSNRLKLPNTVRDRLINWAETPMPDADLKRKAWMRFLYFQDRKAVADRLKLAIAAAGDAKLRSRFVKRLRWTQKTDLPRFPVAGADLIAAGLEPGPAFSEQLKGMEKRWVASDFELGKDELLAAMDLA